MMVCAAAVFSCHLDRSDEGTHATYTGVLSQIWAVLRDLVSPLEAAPTSTSGRTAQQTQVPVLTCLEDLPQAVLLDLCRAGAVGCMPLTLALACERARQSAAGLDSMAWRDLAAGVWSQMHTSTEQP